LIRSDGQGRPPDDVGRRDGLALDVTHDLKGGNGVRGPDAHVGGRGDDKGVLVADVGRILWRRDEEVVGPVRPLDTHVRHVRVGHVGFPVWLNPEPKLPRRIHGTRRCVVVAENLNRYLGGERSPINVLE